VTNYDKKEFILVLAGAIGVAICWTMILHCGG
jgi:hypothetical protein